MLDNTQLKIRDLNLSLAQTQMNEIMPRYSSLRPLKIQAMSPDLFEASPQRGFEDGEDIENIVVHVLSGSETKGI